MEYIYTHVSQHLCMTTLHIVPSSPQFSRLGAHQVFCVVRLFVLYIVRVTVWLFLAHS